MPLAQPIDNHLCKLREFTRVAAVPFRKFAGWVKRSSILQPLLKCCQHCLAIAHQTSLIQIQNFIDVSINSGIIGLDSAVAQELNLSFNGAGCIRYAEAKAIIAFASIAMLFALRMTVVAKAGTMQVAEIELALRVGLLALPMLNLHFLWCWPDAGLAITAEAALFSYERDPQTSLVRIVVIIGMWLFPVECECAGFRPLLDGPHLVGALQKVNQRTGTGQLGLSLA